MQPRMTVALVATVWFTVAGLVGGTVALRLSNDQYFPASPHRYAELQRDQTRDWRVHDRPAEDQPLDLWIGSRRSIPAEELKALRHNAKFAKQDFSLEKPLKDIVSSKRVYSLSSWQRRLPNITTTTEFATDKVDYGYEMPETLSREAMVPRSDPLDDPFVADDTFQDQGPGSMEIYKLDLSKEKALLTATTPPTNLPSRNKSKAPKKMMGHLNLKTEIKSTTIDPRVHHRQSNFFEDQRTEISLVNRDAFDVGGVPELQVGCEGLEASPSSHKAKRSIDTSDKEEKGMVPASVLLDVMPISLDLDYNLSYDEENYEEMDELFKLKKLETVTKGNKPNRGDMDASHLNSDHLDESRRPEKLPIRGDLGKSIPQSFRELVIDREKSQKLTDLEIKRGTKAKRALVSSNDAIKNQGLLWLAQAERFEDETGKRKRARRSANWGFGENEGVVSSDELQTVNERRRQHEMRYHQDVSKRRDQHRGINPDVDSIRREYEKLLEQKRREEEERLRRMQQGDRNTLSRWEEEERRRDEMRKTQYHKYRSRMDHTSTPRMDDEETRRRQMEERQRQEIERNRTQEMARRKEEERKRLREEEEQRRRLQEEEETRKRPHNNKWNEENARRSEFETPVSNKKRRQRLHNEEIRRREEERQRQLQKEEQYRSQQEARRRKEEEERRRQEDRARNFSEDDRRRLEERRREWLEKKRQREENETRRQQPPSNLMRMGHRTGHPNDIRQRDQDEERRMREEERQREQKLREYIARNQPINVTPADRKSEEKRGRYRPEESRDPRINASRNDEEYRAREQHRRQEEERKLQDYIRRNQPVSVPSRSNQSSVTDRNWFEERRLIEEARRREPDRYPDLGTKRHHGPSAPTYNIDRHEEVRQRQRQETERKLEDRRQRYEAEEWRKDPIARRQREEEERRLREEARRREEETRRREEEARRREEETRKAQSRRYEEDRKRLEALKLQAERRRQEMLKERSRNEAAGRTRQPEATRPTYYQDPRLLEHRRRQDSQPIPTNLVQEEARRAAAEREKQRLMEVERRRQDDSRMREHRPKETDQWRRQELVRLNSLPVSARIIVVPPGSSSPVSPVVISRTGFDNEIDFTGINPHREGIQAPKFPVPPTSRPPPKTPGPCVWAIVQCCSPNNNRLVKCFESMGCPGVNWDPDPCRGAIANAARAEVMKFYAIASNQ